MDEITRYKQCLLRHQVGRGGDNGLWGNMDVFRGRRGQRGFGFGWKGFGKIVLPFAKYLGKKLLKTAIEGGKDILLNKKDAKSVIASRGKQLLGSYLEDASKQFGTGRRKRNIPIELLLENYGGQVKRSRKSR